MKPETSPEIKPPDSSEVIVNALLLWNDLRKLTYNHVQLMSLEMQRAGENLVAMLVYGVVLSVLLICSWLGMLCAIIMWLIEKDFMVSSAILLTTLCNVISIYAVMCVIRYKSYQLRLPATIRCLDPELRNTTPPEHVE